MNATGYAEPVTDDERDQLTAAHAAVVETEAAYKAAVEHRNALMRRLYRNQVNVREMVEVTGLFRTVVHGIVRGARPPQPRRGSRL